MSVRCNLFKPLSSPTGEFYMFAQFAEDIAKQTTDNTAYRVSPSRFAVMNLNLSGLDGIDDRSEVDQGSQGIINDYNHAIAKVFQNYFENVYSIIRADSNWKPSYLNNILWTTLWKYNMIKKVEHSVPETNTSYYTYDELKYIGDIPFYNSRDVDSMVYNEIYCHIPISEKEYRYVVESNDVSTRAWRGSGDTISGWTTANYPTQADIDIKPLYDTTNREYNIIGEEGLIPLELYTSVNNQQDIQEEYRIEQDSSSYQFNSIIVFYDIYDISNPSRPTEIYRNIPMGIYFTGVINHIDDIYSFTNTATKYVSNDDTFGQGSSYGVRIMTRYTPTPNSNVYFTDVSGDQDTASLAVMMGELGDTLTEIREMVRNTTSYSQDIKDHLAMFKNNRTNVPYIRKVNGQDIWFVNGRNTGVRAN